MKVTTVLTERQCAQVIVTKDNYKSLDAITLPKGSVVMAAIIQVVDAANAGVKLQIKKADETIGANVDLTAVAVTEERKIGKLQKDEAFTFNITGDITQGAVVVLLDYYTPTQKDKGI
jgi:hypothetical protein